MEYGTNATIIRMSFFRKLFGLGPKVDCHELLANGAVLVDVRTPEDLKFLFFTSPNISVEDQSKKGYNPFVFVPLEYQSKF